MKRLSIFLLITGIILFISSFFMATYITLFVEKKVIETDCYDEYLNKIKNLKCSKEVHASQEIDDLIGLSALIAFVATGFFVIGYTGLKLS